MTHKEFPSPTELSDEQLDHVTGGGATVISTGPGAIIGLPCQASSTAGGGGIDSANSNAGTHPATLLLPKC
jgi:hypothetical protein